MLIEADKRGVCQLIVRGLLPRDTSGSWKLETWLPDEELHALYERFLLEYFKFHHPELRPQAPKIPWDTDAFSLPSSQLPQMRTDLVLSRGNKRLIIDAKYYSKALDLSALGQSWSRNSNGSPIGEKLRPKCYEATMSLSEMDLISVE